MRTSTPITTPPGAPIARILSAVAILAAVAGVAALPAAPAGATVGAAWSGPDALVPANADLGHYSATTAMSCPAPGNCVAVGLYKSGGATLGYADVQADGTWMATELPVPPGAATGPSVEPGAISCAAVGSCVASARYTAPGNVAEEAIFTLSSGAWSVQAAPLPTGAAPAPKPTVYNLTCPAAGSCVAVGNYLGSTQEGLLLTESGGTWTATSAPLPSNHTGSPDPQVISVACWAAGACEAVGQYHTTGGHNTGLVEVLAAGVWSDAQAPVPPGSGSPAQMSLFGVACPAASNCTATGEYSTSGGSVAAALVTNMGGALTAATAPAPSNAVSGPTGGAALYAISCPTPTWCTAVGAYSTAPGTTTEAPYLDVLSGGTWQATEAPGLPAGAKGLLSGISCSWPGACAAVGLILSGTTPVGFIETLTDGTWTEQNAVLPPGVTENGFFGVSELSGGTVSCVAGTCAIAGAYGITTSTPGGFIDTYPGLDGYQEVASDGGLFAFGTPFFGSMGGMPLNQPIVAMAVKPDNGGYYEVASDGGIFAFGAPFHGSMGGKPLNEPIVGIAFDTLTGGYYEVASDGGIFAFTAPFHGSMGGKPLNAPIVGIAFDPGTGGYYEVASDGGIFAFTAPFHGSMGGKPLNEPIVGITVDTATGGYYEVASDGGLFAFTAPFHGSMGGMPLNEPIVGMAYDYVTGGYYEVASDGGLFAFTAPFNGSMGGMPLNKPVVGIAFG